MNYVWDIVVKARQLEIPEKTIKFEVAQSYSPYMELSNVNINFTEVEEAVELNPYFRFYEIFKDMFNINNEEDVEFREKLFDVTMHFLTEIDTMQGMNKKEYYTRFLLDDIKRGILGDEIRDKLSLFSVNEKNIIAANIIRLYITGEMLYLLKDTIRKIFKNSTIYANYETKDELLFYIPFKKNDKNVAKMELIKEIFLPIKFHTETYWNDHFGIIGVEDTMKIDGIALY